MQGLMGSSGHPWGILSLLHQLSEMISLQNGVYLYRRMQDIQKVTYFPSSGCRRQQGWVWLLAHAETMVELVSWKKSWVSRWGLLTPWKASTNISDWNWLNRFLVDWKTRPDPMDDLRFFPLDVGSGEGFWPVIVSYLSTIPQSPYGAPIWRSPKETGRGGLGLAAGLITLQDKCLRSIQGHSKPQTSRF